MFPMKQYTMLAMMAAAGLAFSGQAQAVELPSGNVLCVQKRYLTKYQDHVENEQIAFATDMRDRAQCVINQRDYDVAVLEKSGDSARVEVLNGTRVWVNAAALAVETVAE